MKKTLVALAILAASGASFAQATITGSYAFGYKSTTGGGAAASSGLGTDTSDINFAASEDLSGGMKASAKMGISNANRGAAVTGNTATLGLSSSSFGLTLGTIESTNGLLAIGSSGAAGFGLDGTVISGSSNIDLLALSIPLSSALTLGASYADRGATAATGLGEGTVGTAAAAPSVGLSITYAAGPFAAKGDYTSWNRLNDTTVTNAVNKSRIRLSAGYDMGVARVSAGYSNLQRDNSVLATGTTVTETLLGVKVPMGAVTIGLDYGMSTVTGTDDVSGFSLGVGYDLSKRTNIGASVANVKARTWTGIANPAATENTNMFRVLVAHSF
jgi:Gram-negative porin